ncbi:GDSL-type esterase/lipase family protein [Streptomyces sp. NPDC050147]|uniref:GDSL-type esterase/lipase family protein n=1 Tax=Streptomyces sp. NPDC050147 TaxID=3155513 RepID=UPI0034471C65
MTEEAGTRRRGGATAAGHTRRHALALMGTTAAAGLTAAASARAADAQGGRRWVTTWSTAMTPPSLGMGTNWSQEGFAGHSVRQLARVSLGGRTFRARLSHHFGTRPLRLAGATVALSAGGAELRPETVRRLTFDGASSVTVAPGGTLASDAVHLKVAAHERVAVTLYFEHPTGPVTFHPWAGGTSHRASGDHRDDTGGAAFTETTGSTYCLAAIDVAAPARQYTVMCFGDSLTDGYGSAPDRDERYPDTLSELLAAQGTPHAVANTGISGNRLLNDTFCLGDKATRRFRRDALTQPGVRKLVVQLGGNDITVHSNHPCFGDTPEVTPEELAAGHRELLRQAEEFGLPVIGITKPPYGSAPNYKEHHDKIRMGLNAWMRQESRYAAVIDSDRLLGDPTDPVRLDPRFDSGDGVHPNGAGYAVMAAAVARHLR